ncbi:hypothetical protein NNJEOMEG_03291 [Fundidesulfovibrio magnetotacticus]|uniref:SWIM-type domain-containing protein n=1 Tax=Fundidesulfovibrio magnetotacticus TaxID=2730080 RepID=A0A6V8LYW9_9BACT|nr:hypothetical protein [Fundidesulfovibrio magnetotacticus]GFK95428.1 hypothetical protein NNJEOMEG_03291 [Fundidesulfovibrio magnetotacticus]
MSQATTLTLLAQGSEGIYRVELRWAADKLMISCDCRAGIFNKLCKHKTGVLAGDIDILANTDEQEPSKAMAEAQAMLAKAGLESVTEFSTQLRALEAEKDILERKIKNLKAVFAKQIAAGFSVRP